MRTLAAETIKNIYRHSDEESDLSPSSDIFCVEETPRPIHLPKVLDEGLLKT